MIGGHFTRFSGRGNYPQAGGTRPGVAISRLTEESGDHVSLRWRRQATETSVGDEPKGDPYIGLVSSHDEVDGVGPIWQRSGALRGGAG